MSNALFKQMKVRNEQSNQRESVLRHFLTMRAIQKG